MFNDAYILSGSLFGAIALLGFWLSKVLGGNDDDKRVRQRLTLRDFNTGTQADGKKATSKTKFKDLITRLGQAASKPFMPEEREKQSELRRRLAMAGIYTPSAIRVVTGFKVILLGGGVVGGYIA